jgi:AI-2 transport protein TqsA
MRRSGCYDGIAERVRQYLGVTAVTSVITGAASSLWALAMGLGLALVWGCSTFCSISSRVVGNIVGTLPPTLFAIVQFQSWTLALLVFLGFGVPQLVI